ncbi:DNA repair protein RecN [Geomesophilobacter sediminis]|uniref:DNA repair protein RecN n=1 Tax=Geomesophilobacter sediminis TaxID=2798584 RepID=A0A8J7J592_9BACT|nr:DNA repair protein RecN [Geomesophilobacter sediminis]MBJ6723551.1 DNA repair protein RecN [Geomesophilobacter sediminis]
MLRELQIKNLAIIENLHVEFHGGMNILTGETGAGKSIIIDAVNLILGGRASTDLIRAGAEEASVEAVFDLSDRPELVSELAERGIDCDGELLVRRVVSRGGKNRVFIGGGLATTAILAELARLLINIYGQHESQTLLKTDRHLHLLDGFAGCLPLRSTFATLFDEYSRTRAELQELEEGEREAARRIDILAFQSEEIAAAKLSENEEEELAEERRLLAHGEKLRLLTGQAYDTLYGNDAAVLGGVRRAISSVTEAGSVDASLAPVLETLEGAYAQLEDASLTLRDYGARIETDPARLEQLDDRIDQLNRLKRKYGETVADVIRYHRDIEAELAQLAGREVAKGELVEKLDRLRAEMARQGAVLTKARQAGAGELKKGMERELGELAMKHSLFDTSFETFSEPKAAGYERAEFLFSPNPGEPPKPLAKIASGGELSRLMLALKQLHPESDVPTLIFDEVDTGIGGATSELVGKKLKKVASSQQVLAITHLPQVAAFADWHLKVEKSVVNGRTLTMVIPLSGDDKVAEVARMLGGARVTEKTLEHARELIQEAAT